MSKACLHCGLPVPEGGDSDFCCPGCKTAYAIIHDLGLDGWYERRVLQEGVRAPKPDDFDGGPDPASYVRVDDEGIARLNLMVEGLHCAACVWLIESILARQPGVVSARVNMTTRRLVLRWRQTENDAQALVNAVTALGYRLLPYDPGRLREEGRETERVLLRAMAVAGFAAGNVMLLSVSVWAGAFSGMEAVTRDFLHWISALIALPAIVYAGWPFFSSAAKALKGGRFNMDVPISLAVILSAAMSLFETIRGGEHAYFDAAVTLLFFLLIGRYLDRRARAKARSAAERLVNLGATAATVEDENGRRRSVPVSEVMPGAVVHVAAGERIPVDGVVESGVSDVDSSLVTGESLPARTAEGGKVFAGTLNLSGALRIHTVAAGEDTLLAEIVRLMELAEQGQARYVAIADRVARLYAPAVHLFGLATLVVWLAVGAPWQTALLYAVAVLIITCPCALALAVPIVQAVASGRLYQSGVLIRSADALERTSQADMVVFDKTGTLTLGRPRLREEDQDAEDLRLAASVAAASRHPLARALAAAVPDVVPQAKVREVAGEGLIAETGMGEIRLGRREWCGAPAAAGEDSPLPELWLASPGREPVRFRFADMLRADAAAVVAACKGRGLEVALLSGDLPPVVAAVAAELGIGDWRAGLRPDEKSRHLEDLAKCGKHILMVGDGLNDAPALASAFVSMSPSTAAEITQTASDVVFQGDQLKPVVEVMTVARKAERLVLQNLGIAFLYNAVAIPAAMAGYVTPLVAALAMSSSSILVTLNSLRLWRRR
jgi:Cu2+-exporting ATPase